MELEQALEQIKMLTETVNKLEENQSKQNSYITKLEGDLKEAKAKPAPAPQPAPQPTAAPAPGMSANYIAHTKRRWREDVCNEAFVQLKGKFNEEQVNVLQQEVLDYCHKNMTDNNTTTEFVESVFHLLFGRAVGDKNHAIHKTLEKKQEAPTPAPTATNAMPESKVAQIIPPSVATTEDRTYNPSVPTPSHETKVKSTDDAFASFKATLNGLR